MQSPAGLTASFWVRLTHRVRDEHRVLTRLVTETRATRQLCHHWAFKAKPRPLLKGWGQPEAKRGHGLGLVALQDCQELHFATGGSEHPQWLPPTGRPCQQARNTKGKPKSTGGSSQPHSSLLHPSPSRQDLLQGPGTPKPLIYRAVCTGEDKILSCNYNIMMVVFPKEQLLVCLFFRMPTEMLLSLPWEFSLRGSSSPSSQTIHSHFQAAPIVNSTEY